MDVPFVDLRAQYRSIATEIDAAIQDVLDRADFILGQDVERFEAEFAQYSRTAHAVGVSNGLDAIRLALTAIGVEPGDEIIIPANTFIATALAVTAVGARPILVDCDPRSFNLDPSQLAGALTPRTKAIVPVHLAGQPAEMDPILEIARAAGVLVVEDAAQAHGARYRGKAPGELTDVACFSFYPAKNLGAYGDAGAVVTNDPAIADRLRLLRNYGQRVKYEHAIQGLNARLDTLQAAVLRVKLRHLDSWNAARARHAARYTQLLAGVAGVEVPRAASHVTPAWHLYMIRAERREELRGHLESAGIRVNVHYPIPIHLQPAFSSLGHRRGDFPVAEELARTLLSLPMYAELTDAQLDHVAERVREFAAAA